MALLVTRVRTGLVPTGQLGQVLCAVHTQPGGWEPRAPATPPIAELSHSDS